MSITIEKYYNNPVACIGSGQEVYIYSTNYYQPNFYVHLRVTDGFGLDRIYYLYPNPNDHRCYFNLDLLIDSFFKEPFLLNTISDGVTLLDRSHTHSNIRRFTLSATAYWTGGSETGSLNIYAIYNADKTLDGYYSGLENNIFPFINNKIYIHNNCRVIFNNYDFITNNIFVNIAAFDSDNNGDLLYTYTKDAERQVVFNYTYDYFANLKYIQIYHNFGYNIYNIIDTSCKKSGIMVYFWTTKGTIESYYFPSYTEVLSGVQRNVIKTNKGWTMGTNNIYSDYNSFGGTYTKQLQITSDLLDDYDAKALSYLLTSPYIFFKFCDVGMDNVYYNAIIKDTNYDITSYKRNKYTTKQFTLDYKELKF